MKLRRRAAAHPAGRKGPIRPRLEGSKPLDIEPRGLNIHCEKPLRLQVFGKGGRSCHDLDIGITKLLQSREGITQMTPVQDVVDENDSLESRPCDPGWNLKVGSNDNQSPTAWRVTSRGSLNR